MTYALSADVEALIPQYARGTWKHTTAQVTSVLDMIDGQINASLAARGLTVPYETAGSFLEFLTGLNAQGAAWLIVKGLFPASSGPNETPAWAPFRELYLMGLDGLKDGSMIPLTVSDAAGNVQPSTVNTTHPDADVRDEMGTHGAPFFHRRMRF